MSSWYELEEIVGRYWHNWVASASSYPHHPQAEVSLDEVRHALAVYFRALGGGTSVAVNSALATGSDHRLTLRQRMGFEREPIEPAHRDEENLVLPAKLAFFPEREHNRGLYFWLAGFLAEARTPNAPRDPLQRDLCEIAEADRAARLLCARFPGLARRYQRLCEALLRIRPRRRLPSGEAELEELIRYLLGSTDALSERAESMLAFVRGEQVLDHFRAPRKYRSPLPVPLWGQVTDSSGTGEKQPEDDPEPGIDSGDSDGVLRSGERRHLDETERDDPLMLNPFEKMLSWSEMVNVNRPVEDDEEEDARKAADQLEELTLSKHRKKASTRLKMELDVASEAVDETPVQAPLTYPEWHYRKGRYLPDHCAVYAGDAPETPPDGGPGWQPDEETRRRIRRIQRQFEALRPRRELLRRQMDGDELDVDALVDSMAEQAAGGHGSENVYMRWREQGRDLAMATLVDTSLSTDAWIEDRRVLDVEKEALLVLAHGVQACGDEHAIYTFTSRRRQRVNVQRVKNFDERVSTRTEQRIGALEPGLYTRMGAAIRHVSAELARRDNRHRLLLVLTDGKPNDTDHYEGRFAIEDTARAVREARRQGLSVFAVTVDAEARQYLPAIFGRGGYAIVARPAGLANALPLLYRQLIQ